jgi:hypothetical protein
MNIYGADMTSFQNVLIMLDDREHTRGNWWTAWVMNRILNMLIGLPLAVLFAIVASFLIDQLVPVAGVRFYAVWASLGPQATLHGFFGALDACDLGAAWLLRLDITAVIGVIGFGLPVGSQIRKSILGSPRSSFMQHIAFALLLMLAASAVAVIHLPANPNAAACVGKLWIPSF